MLEMLAKDYFYKKTTDAISKTTFKKNKNIIKFAKDIILHEFQEFQMKFVLAPADKAANNVVVLRKMYYNNTLKQYLGTAKTYDHNLPDEKPVVDRHRCHMAAKCDVFVNPKSTTSFCSRRQFTGPRSAVCNVSGNRCESDYRSRGREFNASLVSYFRRDKS